MKRLGLAALSALFVMCLAFASSTAAARQASQTPVRDVRTEPTGSAIISGIVETDDSTPKPLRRANVTLSGSQLMTGRRVVTGDDGRFVFVGLPAGQFMLSAQKSSFMDAVYGATRPGGTGSAINLVDAQKVDVALRLSKFAAITGVIYDQNGEPAAGISVEGLRYTMRTGQRSLASVYGQPATTDDRGIYRLDGLSPGDYFVAAGPSPDHGPSDVQVLSVSDVDRALRIGATGAPPTPASALSQPHQSFAPVFFPGSTDLGAAEKITLGLGEERTDVNIHLQLVPTARVDGVVNRFDGGPISGVQVVAAIVTEAFSMDLFDAARVGSAPVDAQGRFAYPALAPGRYVFTARSSPSRGSAQAADVGPLWALAEVSVSGADQAVALTMQPGMSVSGRVAFDGTSLKPPSNMNSIRVGMPATQRSSGISIGVTAATVGADGTFRLVGAAPGSYRLTSSAPSTPGWSLRSAMVNGVDALDLPFELRPTQNIDAVVVTFTDHPTVLDGTLQTQGGTPTADYFIVVFAADKTFWTPSSRRSVSARPATTGKYEVKNLPPGEYLVAAVTDVEFGDWWDPAFLERLLPAATRITLGEGEKKTLDLKIGR